jgi:subtilisin-like proprotein convertase family protein
LALAFAAAAPGAAIAKKSPNVNVLKEVNAAVPDATPSGSGVLESTIEVGKRFRGKRIRDVEVTLQAGAATGNNTILDLQIRLTSPTGQSVWLLPLGIGPGNILGPVTFDDESEVTLMIGGSAVGDPTLLPPPWQGTVQPQGAALGTGSKPLSLMDGGRVRGTWTLTVNDLVANDTSTLHFWRLNVSARRPYLTRG